MDRRLLERISAAALNDIFGYEPKLSHHIIDVLGSAEAVFSLSDSQKAEAFGPYSRFLPRINDSSLEKAQRQIEDLESRGNRVISIFEDDYPALLRECEDAPLVLYVRSSSPPEEIFNVRPAISVVGTRDISLYGKEWCSRIVGAISRAQDKPVIVSGLAIGVDINAHMAALAFGLPTIAVLPVGIEDVYPRRHRVAAEKIAASRGSAIITDYPPGTNAIAVNFLRRNRIIAGISQATILVESKSKGGGTMTARLAAGYGRELFALPGRIDDIRSEGCNLLLREKLAEPIVSLDELPESLGLGKYNRRNSRSLEEEIAARYGRSLPEQDLAMITAICMAVKKNRGISIDELCAMLGCTYHETVRLTGLLETDRFIDIDLLQRCVINPKNY